MRQELAGRPALEKRVILVFVDGLGIGGGDAGVNPVHSGACPHLSGMLRRSKPIDACLGVPGVPQSATGQTTLLTGINAAQVVGRHVEGFPNAELKTIIRRHSLFARLSQAGLTSTFANGYWAETVEEAERMPLHSPATSILWPGM